MNERTKQIKIYGKQHFVLYMKEKGWKNILFALGIALLVRIFAMNNVFVRDMETRMVSLAIACVCIWNGIFNSIQSICKERNIIKKEHRSGLHMSSYFISHMTFQAVVCLIQAFAILAALTFGAGYEFGVVFYIELFITFFITTFAADVLGLAISSIVKNPTTAMTVMPFVLIVQLMFAGVLFPMNEKITRLTISKSSMEAMFVSADYNSLESYQADQLNNYIDQIDICDIIEKEVGGTYSYISESDKEYIEKETKRAIKDYLDDEAYENGSKDETKEHTVKNLVVNWGCLILHIIAYMFIGILFLERIDKDRV